MSFDQSLGEYQCLIVLAERIEQDRENSGWYMHRAYMLGQGCSVSEALELAPAKKPALILVKS